MLQSASAARVSLLIAGVPTFISKESPEDEEEGTIDLKFRVSGLYDVDFTGSSSSIVLTVLY